MTDPSASHAAVTYSSYLKVGELLTLQEPRSTGADGRAEHDELLFITIHQVYEIWFKQLLHELRGDESAPGAGGVQGALAAGQGYAALGLLGRVLKILKTLVAQVDVLETMTPLQFESFRARLDSASGFQSGQFREIEAVLGRRDARMLSTAVPGDPVWDRVAAATRRPSLWHSFLTYVARRGVAIPAHVAERPVTEPSEPDEELQAALASLYRTDGEGALVAERLVDLDEGLQEWRYRHVKMVERTIGTKQGTGGSSGAAYLAGTLFTPVFPDLWQARSRF